MPPNTAPPIQPRIAQTSTPTLCLTQAEEAEIEEPSAFDLGSASKEPASSGSASLSLFDSVKCGSYLKSKPVGDPQRMASWGYSMSPVPPLGRRPSMDSNATGGEQNWKLFRVRLSGSGADVLHHGLLPEEERRAQEAEQGMEIPEGVKQYRQKVAQHKKLGIKTSPGVGPVNAKGGTAPLPHNVPTYYLPQATFHLPPPPPPLDQLPQLPDWALQALG